MPEALTDSFCERCGTRYEFAAPTRLNTARKTRGLISGLRNYIMSQDTLSDAVGDAMRAEEETLAAAQLDAFHESFNFCIQCRQYTCVNCWNEAAGRCRTCVPVAGTDDLIERFEASFSAQHAATVPDGTELSDADLGRRLGVEAWPSEDLSSAASNGAGWSEPGQELEPEPVAAETAAAETIAEDEPLREEEPIVAEVEAEPEPVASPAVPPEPMWPVMAVAAAEAEPVAVAWEDDAPIMLEAEPAPEPEPVLAVVEAEPEPEPAAAELAPEPEAEAEPEPVLGSVEAEPEPEPEPVLGSVEAEPEVEPEPGPPAPRPILPISETILRIPRHEPAPEPEAAPLAAVQEDPTLAARRAQLDLLGLGDPGEGPVATGAPNVLPYRSSGAGVHPAELAARGASGMPTAVVGSFWDASAREVAGAMTSIGVQACGHCGLSLSASARFCRRCGTRQARSA
jgi:ribosomal protein L40E